MNKLTITINIKKKGDNAVAHMAIVDENKNSDFSLCGLHWLAVARVLSSFALEAMEKAAVAIQEDDKNKGGQP